MNCRICGVELGLEPFLAIDKERQAHTACIEKEQEEASELPHRLFVALKEVTSFLEQVNREFSYHPPITYEHIRESIPGVLTDLELRKLLNRAERAGL